jgi:O-antigen/teichoic acid export membrane protein
LLNFRKGVTKASCLAIGNVVSQGIAVVGFIYIAKLLGPSNYGVYASVGAFVTMFNIFTFDGLGKVLIREGCKNLSSLESLYNRTVGMRVLFLTLAMALCVLSVFFTPYDNQTKLFIVLFSFQIFYEGMTSFFSSIYQIVEKMRYISIIDIVNRLFFVLLSISFLWAGYGLPALIIISFIVNAGMLIYNFFVARRFVRFDPFSRVRFEREILKPAVFFSLFGIVTTLSSRFDLFIISVLGTPVQVGVYAVAFKLAQQGQMLRNVNAMAFFPIFVKRFQQGKIGGLKMIKYGATFFVGVLAVTVLVSYFCVDVVIFLLGDEYRESGRILSVLILSLAAVWGTLPFTVAAQATNNENLMLKIRTVMAVFNIVLDYIFFRLFGVIGIAYCTLIVWGFGSVAMCVLPYRAMIKQGHVRQAIAWQQKQVFK